MSSFLGLFTDPKSVHVKVVEDRTEIKHKNTTLQTAALTSIKMESKESQVRKGLKQNFPTPIVLL